MSNNHNAGNLEEYQLIKIGAIQELRDAAKQYEEEGRWGAAEIADGAADRIQKELDE